MAAAAVVNGMSRRGGRSLSARERRDVRWALTLKPDAYTHAVDVHGVYIVYRHQARPQPPTQPTRQQVEEKEDVKMDDGDRPTRKTRKEGVARKAKKEERFQAWRRKRIFFDALPVVGEWMRQQQHMREVREAAEAAAAAARAEREQALAKALHDCRIATEEAARARRRADAETARHFNRESDLKRDLSMWKARAEGRFDERDCAWLAQQQRQQQHQPPRAQPDRSGGIGGAMDDERVAGPKRPCEPSSPSSTASEAGASAAGSSGTVGGKGPPTKKSLFRDEATAKEERALLEEASYALASKGSWRGKGKGHASAGKGGGRGRGDAPEPPPSPGPARY